MRLNWYQVAPPEHINLFHRNSLRTLLESYGFEVLTVESIGKRFTMQYAFQKLAHWSGSGVSQQIALRLASYAHRQIGSVHQPVRQHGGLRAKSFLVG